MIVFFGNSESLELGNVFEFTQIDVTEMWFSTGWYNTQLIQLWEGNIWGLQVMCVVKLLAVLSYFTLKNCLIKSINSIRRCACKLFSGELQDLKDGVQCQGTTNKGTCFLHLVTILYQLIFMFITSNIDNVSAFFSHASPILTMILQEIDCQSTASIEVLIWT